MNSIIKFIKDFHANSGSWIASATIFNKIILFVIKAFILVYIEKAIYGQVTYAISVIAFFTPFVGFGSPSGLIRYGSITTSKEERIAITNYSFTQGLINTFILMILIIPFIPLLSRNEENIIFFMGILIFRILGLFLNNHQSVQFRINDMNKQYGLYDITYSIILLILVFVFTYTFYETGYLTALVSAPIITFILYGLRYGFPKLNLNWSFSFSKKSFWSYSFLSSFSGIITQMVFLVDIYLIGIYLGDTYVAEYNAASLIPMNILLLPIIFIRTDFTQIASNYKNRAYLKNYYYNFLKLFFILSVIAMMISYFLGEWMFSFLGDEYNPYELFLYLMFSVCIAIMFRVPLGNMIAAFGKAKFNTISGIITIIISLILNVILIPKFGLKGAAWATCISLVISSMLNFIYFLWYLKYECE